MTVTDYYDTKPLGRDATAAALRHTEPEAVHFRSQFAFKSVLRNTTGIRAAGFGHMWAFDANEKFWQPD